MQYLNLELNLNNVSGDLKNANEKAAQFSYLTKEQCQKRKAQLLTARP